MKFVDDWHWIVNHAWSVRLLILAAMLTGAEAVLPFFFGGPTPWNAFVQFAVTAGALIARFVAQDRPFQP